MNTGKLYDSQAEKWKTYEESSYSWKFLEKPSFDKYLNNFYNNKTKVLDVGCASGRVIKHLILKGIKSSNITGIEPSAKLLEYAKKSLPNNVRLINSNLENMVVEKENFDLVTSNMVFHYLDNESLKKGLNNIYDSLNSKGLLFFVDTDPDNNEIFKNPNNLNKWLEINSPWNTKLPFFNRHPRTLLTELLDIAGFDYVKGWPVKILDEGKINPELYKKYSSTPSRIAALYKKVSEDNKKNRQGFIPSLV
ncbi:MAG: class I SAM-dependent methyltransferase [Candidatus Nanoarchaeia archaeon]|nr:class I SAM-dependent methyltransferase [Candidatus Nanoarchaeia archaeon]